ncbi:ribbon-helix-helix domain-containing protein [uncultured Sneathiella sp.]|jgi:predicted DNA-binding ribbon-helix-helix protein|uniref:ribbon-helix-helix domain-containing protein n=1 Tax=uncultured Sneathiella sp. TaxID=879315 RepID=UPI0030D961D6|tara:strand:+ start:1125 stop:1403 length:279 start_codon:yes stop_codon:yes gene_type:complete
MAPTPDISKVAPAQLVKHSVSIAGHRTSISLEKKFWDLIRASAQRQQMSINELLTEIDATRIGNLSSSIRLYVLEELLEKDNEQGEYPKISL